MKESIDIKDYITLDDNNKYLVVSKIIYKEETYFYFVNLNNYSSFKILKLNQETGSLIETENQELIKILLPLFLKNSINELTKK